jgi:RNA polymerase sigma factor (sigma-70 family)
MPGQVGDVTGGSGDEEIIRRSLAHPTIFGEVFERNFDAVRAYLARRLDASAADDLASEAFLRAFRDRARYDPSRGSVRAWLFGITNNLLRQHWRTEERGLRALARASVLSVNDMEWAGEGVEARVDAGAIAARLVDALTAMPREYREVLLLHAWADLTPAEISQALSLPAGTVRSRLSRARAAVRERIGVTGEEEHEELWQERAGDGRSGTHS